MQARVFVSHSSKTPEEEVVRARICDALRDAGFEVLVDVAAISAGLAWRQEIHQWMANCHACVLLLSPSALQSSDWVLKEATCLTWRRELDKTFVLLPWLVAGTTSADLEREKRFSPLLLGEVERVQAADVEGAVREIVTVLHPLATKRPQTPLERLVATVRGVLTTVHENNLDTLATQLGLADTPWIPGIPRHTQAAERLARRIVGEGWRGLLDVVMALPGLATPDTARSIIKLLTPFWVSPAAAGRLPGARPGRGRTLAMNGELLWEFTAESYVRRAHWVDVNWMLVKLSRGTGPDGEKDIVENLLDEVARQRGSQAQPEAKRRALAEVWLGKTGQTVFVLIPAPVPDPEICARLEGRFPKAVFIAHAGPRLPPRSDHFEPVEPELDLATESDAYVAWGDAESMVANFP